jgi:hypothetical protein
MMFLVETPETKKLAEIFCEAFLILKTKSVSVMQHFLNSIAVR